MIPSRGICWSSQTIGIGRRRLEPFSARQFSSSIAQNTPFKPNPLLSKNATSSLRIYTRSQFSKTNTLIRNGAGIRFASTAPVVPEIPKVVAEPAAAVSSTASSPEVVASSLDNAADLGFDSLQNFPEQIGYLKAMGLDYGNGPTAIMEWTLEHVHVYTGTPWWISIILTGVLIRTVMFKFFMGASDNAAKMSVVKPIVAPLVEEMKVANRDGDMDKVMRIRQEMSLVNRRAGIVWWKSFTPFLQAFVGYGTWVCLRGMASLPVPALETGGVLWFHNLTVPDPYLILPLATAGVLHWVIRRGGEAGSTTMNPAVAKIMMIAFPAMSFLFTFWLPAAVSLSFFTTGLLSYLQMTLFKNPKFRKMFGLQQFPADSTPKSTATPSPYRGNMKIRTQEPLSQAELTRTYIQPSGTQSLTFKAGQQTIQDAKPPGAFKKIMGGAVTDLKTTFKSAKEGASDISKLATDKLEERKLKAEKRAAREYEQKRQQELKDQEIERQQQRIEERRAKKLEQQQRMEEQGARKSKNKSR